MDITYIRMEGEGAWRDIEYEEVSTRAPREPATLSDAILAFTTADDITHHSSLNGKTPDQA